MDLGQLSRRGFVAKSLGALGGLSMFAGLTRGARASWSSCSSWSNNRCYDPCGYDPCYAPVDCCAPAPVCCEPAPTCCAPPPCGYNGNGYHGNGYEAAPPPAEGAPAPPAAYRSRSRYYRVSRQRTYYRPRYAHLGLLER